MRTSPNCPHCNSYDARPLDAAVTGVAGYRCHDCAKVFYVASPDVTKQLQDAGTPQTPTADKPAA